MKLTHSSDELCGNHGVIRRGVLMVAIVVAMVDHWWWCHDGSGCRCHAVVIE